MVQSFHVLLQTWFLFYSGVVLPSLAIEDSTKYPDLETTQYVDDIGHTAIDPEPSEVTDVLKVVTSESTRKDVAAFKLPAARNVEGSSSTSEAPVSEAPAIRDDDNSFSTSEATVSEETATECSEPTTLSVSVEALGPTAISVVWNLTGCYSHEASGYNITVTPVSPAGTNCSLDKNTRHETAGADDSSLNISKLSPYYTYKVNVTALWGSDDELITEGTDVTTSQGSPPVPRISTTVNNTTVHVRWELVDCIPAELASYNVSVIGIKALGENCINDTKFHINIVSVNESEFTMTGLLAYHSYNVTVTVEAMTGEQATGAAGVTTLPIGPPVPRISTTVNDTTVHVRWELVGCIPAELASYNVSVIGIKAFGENCRNDTQFHTNIVSVDESEFTVTGLLAYHSYNVTVTAETMTGEQATGAAGVTTLPVGPPVPRITTAVNNTTVHVRWKLVDCVPAELASYNVSVIGIKALGENCIDDTKFHTNIVSVDESEFTMTGLLAYHGYNVTVTVETMTGEQATAAAGVTTLPVVPPAPVIEEAVAVDSSQFSITWSMDSECIPGVLKNYIVSVIFNGSQDFNCEFNEDPVSITVPSAGLNQTYIYEEALPYSLYHVAVAAETESGPGQFSTKAEIITKEQVPPAPVIHAEDVAASYFTVSWALSGCINSTVKDFLVSGFWIDSRHSKEGICEFNGSKTFQQHVASDEMYYTFHEAIAYSVYTVEVKAFTEGDQYGDSSWLNISTHETDPPIPDVSIIAVDETFVKVSWKMTVCVQANITSYNVSLTPLGPKGTDCASDTLLHTLEVDSDQTDVEINDLFPYHEYVVTVMAKTELGKNNSGESTVTTLQAVPPAPVMNSSSYGNTTALFVFWNMKGCIPGILLNYTIVVNFLQSNNSECHFTQEPFTTIVPASDNLYVYESALPYSIYQVSVAAETGRGQGEFSEALTIITEEDLPPAPNITSYDFRSKDITVDWSMPACVNGSISNFSILISPKGYVGNEECPSDTEVWSSVTLPPYIRKYTHEPVNPYSLYSVDIAAQTAAGQGTSASIESQTDVYYPDQVRNIVVLDVAYNHSNATVSWEKPCRFNGEPTQYIVSLVGTHDYFESFGSSVQAEAESVVVTDLRPEYQYSVKVRANNKHFFSDSSPILFYQPANIPAYTGTLSAADPYATDDATTKAHFTLSQDLFDPRAGCVVHYAILVAEESQDREPKQGVLNGSCSDWLKTENVAQVTPLCWKPFEANSTCMNSSKISFTIGANSSCATDYCNAPLKPGTKYYIRVRGYSVSTFADTSYFVFQTDSSVNAGLIAGLIVSFLVAGVGVILFLMYRRGTLPWPPGNLLSKTQVSVRPKPVPVTKFPVHCSRMLEIPSRIANEYQLLQTLSSDITATESFSAGQQPDNKRKNRYVNILPYDSTRVKLDPIAGDPYSDYINASYIKGYSGDIEYIATQGPKEETCSDFWHMVHQQGVKIIVMVTQLEENGKVKCYKYYPNLRENMVMGDITVRCTTELNFPIYTSRTLLLLKGDRQRSLVHLHFREWPDFGCPASADLMLQFVQVLRHQISLAQTGLTAVHCSAGVGRTGTLIAVDILLQHIKENKKVDIFGTVYKLRKQRISMVQSEPQYVYIYRCIKEALLDPSYLETEKHSTSSMEPIYENIGNYTISNTSLINYEKLSENGGQTSSSETA